MDYMIRYLEEQDVDTVVQLLNENLSFGLATKDGVSNFLHSPYSLVAIKDEKVIGFISSGRVDNLSSVLLNHQDCIETVENYKLTNLMKINSLVIHVDYRKLGVATKLRQILLNSFPQNSFLTVGWETPKGWGMKSVAIKQGFKIVLRKEKFWYEDSLKNKYGCVYCGDCCRCSAIIAIKK